MVPPAIAVTVTAMATAIPVAVVVPVTGVVAVAVPTRLVRTAPPLGGAAILTVTVVGTGPTATTESTTAVVRVRDVWSSTTVSPG